MQSTLKKKNVWRVFSKSRGVFKTQASVYDGAFSEYTERVTMFAMKASSQMFDLYTGLQKYRNFQNEANVERIIAIATPRSVSRFI